MTDGLIESYVLYAAKELGTDIVLKATIVLSVSMALTFAFRKASSASRHAIWSVAFVILLTVPAISMLFPSWRVEGYGVPWNDGDASDGIALVVPAKDPHQKAGPAAGRGEFESSAAAPVAAPAGQELPSRRGAGKLVSVLVVLWFVGALVLLLRLLLHIGRVGRITRRATVGDGGELVRLSGPLIASFGISKPVRFVMSDEVTMPFAWGVFSPVIIFPSLAKDWPLERKRSVLAHELAHIARGDYVIHIIVEIVRSFYWPNPIVWLAAQQKSAERERACDDFALREGTPGVEYARHLLDVARLQVEPCVPVGAVTMTDKSGLVDRIHYVMDASLNRSPVRSNGMLVAAVAAFFISLPLGMFDVTASERTKTDDNELVTELRNGEPPLVRSRAAWRLGEREDRSGVDPLINALRDESASVRIASAWALGEIKDGGAIQPLVETLMYDDDVLVREMAALALGEIEQPSAVEPLLAAFEDDDDLYLAVVWALGEIEQRGSRHAGIARAEVFDAVGKRPWRNDQVWTGSLNRSVPRSKDVSELVGNLRSGDDGMRRDAALGLGLLGQRGGYDSMIEVESAVDALLVTLRDNEPEVRAAAVWSLDEINPSRRPDKH